MPQRGKSRRTAARQTQLGQRKRRHTRGPSGTPAAPEPGEAGESATPTLHSENTAAPAVAQPQVQQPIASRVTEARPAVYAYVAPEMKRILAFSGVTMAILVVLTFFLR